MFVLQNTQSNCRIRLDGVSMSYTGASGAIPRNNLYRMDEHAERYYEEIRNRDSDIKSIARNTNHTESDIEEIKQHVFF